jgi:PAS domain S-box-containing protein
MLKSKFLLSLVIIAVGSVLFLPLYILTYLYPSIDKLLIQDAESHARNIASHFSLHLDVSGENLQYRDITPDLKNEITLIVRNFSLEKLKIFSATGEILYSTASEEIGGINDQDYFRSVVMRGKNFTKIVRRNSKTLEGRTVTRDVIETYVPISARDRVVGAFEIYYDITGLREMFGKLIHRSTVIMYGVSFFLITSLLISLYILTRNISARLRAEKALVVRGKELEERVEQRTEEISAANQQMQEDIRKREEVEQNLRVSEERYRSLIEMAGDAIFIADAESGLVTDVNKKATELVGRRPPEVIGTHLLSLHPADDGDLYVRLVKNHYTTAPTNTILYVQHSSGRRIPVEITSSILEYGGRRIILAIFRDSTQRLKIEEELRKSERFKTASVLAGGIAHDINNLLTAILANVSIAQQDAAGRGNILKQLQSIEEAVNRTRGMTRRLLSFAKGGRPVRKPVRLGEIIQDSASFVLHGSGVKCDCEIAPDMWPVNADADQISQVISNIVINASHAMKGSGFCRIRGENIIVHESDRLLQPGRYIRIDIRDEGQGIPEDELDRIFDPFYTTKPQGSGLGLSSAHAIVHNHGGSIQVESMVGKGTTFSVYLPAASDPPAGDEVEPSGMDLKGNGRILVMDDEEMVRDAAANLLRFLGYEVETADEGAAAVRMYQDALSMAKPYEVVIMDLTVSGGLGGSDAVKMLREIDSGARVIVSSGYYTDPVMTNHQAYGFDAAVSKPYLMDELGRAVKEVLAGKT